MYRGCRKNVSVESSLRSPIKNTVFRLLFKWLMEAKKAKADFLKHFAVWHLSTENHWSLKLLDNIDYLAGEAIYEEEDTCNSIGSRVWGA